MVAASKRAEARPRRASSPLVTHAMKPSTDGTLAAVDAPSRMRVSPRSGREPTNTGSAMTTEPGRCNSAVTAVRMTAANAEERADLHDPVVADPISQHPEGR